TFQAGLHSQAGWATATSGHSRARAFAAVTIPSTRSDRAPRGRGALPVEPSGPAPGLGRDSGPLQIGQAQQVVGCRPHISHLLDLPTAHMTHLPQSARLLQPTEDLFHLLAHPLAD